MEHRMEVTRKKASQAELASLMTSLLQEETNDDEADQICRELVEYWVRHYLKRVSSMNRESLLAADTLTDEMPGEKLNVPQDIDNSYQSFLFTEIILCKGITVNEYESGLTTPILYPLPKGFQFAKLLQFSYRTGVDPRLLCQAIGNRS